MESFTRINTPNRYNRFLYLKSFYSIYFVFAHLKTNLHNS